MFIASGSPKRALYSMSFTPEAVTMKDRLGDLAGDLQSLRNCGRVEKWEEVIGARVGTHSSGVWTLIVDEPSLVVLDRRSWDNRSSVAETLQRELLPYKFFFHGHGRMGLQDCPAVGEGFGPCLKMVPLYKNPLAPGETIRFEHDAGKFIEERLYTGDRGKGMKTRISRDSIFVKEASCK
jgi:hypothetical protein